MDRDIRLEGGRGGPLRLLLLPVAVRPDLLVVPAGLRGAVLVVSGHPPLDGVVPGNPRLIHVVLRHPLLPPVRLDPPARVTGRHRDGSLRVVVAEGVRRPAV